MSLEKLYDMLVLHDEITGKRGDCLRACVATLLQEDPVTVPHFVDDPSEPNWVFGLNKFLAPRNLFFVMVPHVRMFWQSAAGPVYYLLIGNSDRGLNHAVVAYNGKIIHDPHPSRSGLITKDPSWLSDLQAGFLVQRGPR